MKLLFSEHKADYGHYIFPYAVWAFPEAGETPADIFNQGFLPSSRELDRFYLCRQVRVDLAKYEASSENRRVLRKGGGIVAALLPRAEFDFNAARRAFCQSYADTKFGSGKMPPERLESLFASRITSHVLVFRDEPTGEEAGLATLYLEPPGLAYYYHAFYDLKRANQNLGMFMMTSAVELCCERRFQHIYLGSCYSRNALYKTQFEGVEFFNGFRWSQNLEELKYLLAREEGGISRHLLEDEEYRATFHEGALEQIISASRLSVQIKPRI